MSYRYRRGAPTLAAIFVATILLRAMCAIAGNASAPPRYTPGRLIFKLSDDLAREARTTLGRNGRSSAVTGDPSLDALLGRYRGHDLSAPFAQRQARAARLDARFPARTARARNAAPAPALEDIFAVELSPDLDMERAARDFA